MQFRFDPNQEYQVSAIEAVTDLLEGQAHLSAAPRFIAGTLSLAAVANELEITDDQLLKNLRAVQERNGIAPDQALACIEEAIETVTGRKQARFPNFSVEMETGTGKTYVYIRTILELFRRYGLTKFVIVVPSVAVREGVLKTLQVTEKHLHELYDNAVYRYYVYDSENLSQVRQFALSDSIEVMVMTIDSFNKASNVIRNSTDKLQGETPIHLVQAARPILILDEPQNMESELRIKALAALDPLMGLRYSATHRNPYNVVYRLTPYEAYRQNLVKRIEVAGVEKQDDENQVYVRLDSITAQRRTITAKVAIHKLMAGGAVKESVVTVKPGDSLADKANRSEYDGWEVEEIDKGAGFVRFANNVEMREGDARGADKEAVFETQTRYTVEEHFRKQERLREHGIKVLSLFFIDRVDNYAPVDGIIRRLFVKAFDELKGKYEAWKDQQSHEVQAAYFAEHRRRSGEVELLDTTISAKSKEDEAAFDLIMKKKEELLSFDNPVAFIFSHSALREGWDNPNVFQICTLNQTGSEVKKRQEVGRGVRLAVDQQGERVHDERLNVLTVVANQSYERYVESLQSEVASEYEAMIEARYGKPLKDLTAEERAEVEAEFGEGILAPKPANARKRGAAKLRKAYTLKPEFRELWEKIKHKTRYSVQIDADRLIGEVVADTNGMEIKPPRVTVSKAEIKVGDDSIFEAMRKSAAKTAIDLSGRYPLPNLVEIMAHLMEHTTPKVRLTRQTLLDIYRKATSKQQRAALDNPQEFATLAVQIIKAKLADHLVGGIKYEKNGQWYEMTQLEEEIPGWEDNLIHAGNSVYDHIALDSEIERRFVEGLEKDKRVRLYLKLPGWFKVATPVGEYNPDWAIVMDDADEHGDVKPGAPKVYLVRETKADDWRTNPRLAAERRKIKCGERHFKGALDVDYRVVSTAGELP